MNDAWNVVLCRVLAAMPNRIDERITVLTALIALVPNGHPASQDIRQSLKDLDSHLIRQRELALVLEQKGSAS